MTRDEIIQLVRDRLGFNKGLDAAIILRHMNYVQDLYETGRDKQPLAWFLFDGTATVTTVAAQRFVNLPEGFISFDDDFPISLSGDFSFTDYNDLLSGDELATGRPTHFALVGNQMYLYPLPDDIYTLEIPHYRRSASLSTTEVSPWFSEFPSLIVEETANSIMRAARDLEGLQMSNINSLRDDYSRRVEARKHTLKTYQMGSVE